MPETSVNISKCCGCNKMLWYKIRLYEKRLDLDIPFDKLPHYVGIADLIIKQEDAHIISLVMTGFNRFRRFHHEDIEHAIIALFPLVNIVFWERHKDNSEIRFSRPLLSTTQSGE